MSGLTIQDAINARKQNKTALDSETVIEDSIEQPEVTEEISEDVTTDEVVEAPEEDIIETEDEEVEVEEDDSEESEESEEDTESQDDETELEFYQIGDIEATLEEIKEWKEGSLRQSDYTKKTQALAEEKKAIEAEKETLNAQLETIKEKTAMLSVLVDENELTAEEWAELKEYDPAEYLEKKEAQDKRKAVLAEKMQELSTPSYSQEYLQAEQAKIFEANKDWLDDKGQLTEKGTKDLKLVNTYLDEVGLPAEERANMVSSLHWKIVLDAARNSVNANKGEAIKKKVKKAPVVTKARAKTQTLNSSERALRAARKAAKENPSIDNLAALRQVERKYKK
jgi:hypothetical protein